ncbi:MAG TPA: sigma-70 family RNA polymerase sigma factor [bacterium]|nr:sigma-70 family RNA polymerase sigma factor [bacterium]
MDFQKDPWPSWTEMMRLTQKGDQAAYERLLTEMGPLVLNFVRKRVFDQQHVEDVVQEVLLTFHKAKHTYRPELPFPPWFFTVVRNAIWSALQKNRRIKVREIPMEELPEVAAQDFAEGGLDDRLQEALQALPEDNRQAVELLKFQGLSVEEAARRLGITKIALRVRAHRGYGLLRKRLIAEDKKKK